MIDQQGRTTRRSRCSPDGQDALHKRAHRQIACASIAERASKPRKLIPDPPGTERSPTPPRTVLRLALGRRQIVRIADGWERRSLESALQRNMRYVASGAADSFPLDTGS